VKLSKSRKSSTFKFSGNTVEVGSRIGTGNNGDVHKVKGNSGLVVKLARGYRGSGRFATEDEWDMVVGFGQAAIRDEAKFIVQNRMTRFSMFKPTKVVYKKHSDTGQNYIGIVRPKLTPIMDYKVSRKSRLPKVTISQLRHIRSQIIKLSKEGIVFYDGIQVGFDKHNKPIIYDAGGMYKSSSIERAFRMNEEVWHEFLSDINIDRDDIPPELETLYE